MHHFRINSSHNRRRIIDVEAGTLTGFCNDANGVRVLVSAAEIMHLSYAFVVIHGRPSRGRFRRDYRFLRRVKELDTVH